MVEKVKPPIIAIANGEYDGPSPPICVDPSASGTMPNTVVETVINTGRKRVTQISLMILSKSSTLGVI